MRMISCPRCGRIHPADACPRKPDRVYKTGTKESKFRSTNAWTRKSIHIRDRDHYLCQACLHNLDGQGVRYTTDRLEVHHIKPIEQYYDGRLDDDNLITLCREHHEMAERGQLLSDELSHIARSNRGAKDPPLSNGCSF